MNQHRKQLMEKYGLTNNSQIDLFLEYVNISPMYHPAFLKELLSRVSRLRSPKTGMNLNYNEACQVVAIYIKLRTNSGLRNLMQHILSLDLEMKLIVETLLSEMLL